MGSAYVATKHAVLALTESLRAEMPDFIDVGLICPGFVMSELGPPEAMALAMDTERFVEIAMKQIKAGAFYIVSHAYNIERIQARHDEISGAYSTYATRYEGDQEFDVRSLMNRSQEVWPEWFAEQVWVESQRRIREILAGLAGNGVSMVLRMLGG